MMLTGNCSLILAITSWSSARLSLVNPDGVNSAREKAFLALHLASHFLTFSIQQKNYDQPSL